MASKSKYNVKLSFHIMYGYLCTLIFRENVSGNSSSINRPIEAVKQPFKESLNF